MNLDACHTQIKSLINVIGKRDSIQKQIHITWVFGLRWNREHVCMFAFVRFVEKMWIHGIDYGPTKVN